MDSEDFCPRIRAGERPSKLCGSIPAEYYERGDVRPGTFDSVIPFYKGKAFWQVSLQCILERIQCTITA